jgi:hypothetical protein
VTGLGAAISTTLGNTDRQPATVGWGRPQPTTPAAVKLPPFLSPEIGAQKSTGSYDDPGDHRCQVQWSQQAFEFVQSATFV